MNFLLFSYYCKSGRVIGWLVDNTLPEKALYTKFYQRIGQLLTTWQKGYSGEKWPIFKMPACHTCDSLRRKINSVLKKLFEILGYLLQSHCHNTGLLLSLSSNHILMTVFFTLWNSLWTVSLDAPSLIRGWYLQWFSTHGTGQNLNWAPNYKLINTAWLKNGGCARKKNREV